MRFKWIRNSFDSDILGINTAKIISVDSPLDISLLLDDLTNADIKYATYRIASKNIDMVQALECSGFVLVDGSIGFTLNTDTVSPLVGSNIREATKNDMQRLKVMSGESFNTTRFFNDPFITPEQAQNVYRNWLENSFNNNEADNILVYEENGIIYGYITTKLGHIPLIAVDKKLQGKGIGKNLVNAAIFYIKKRGIKVADLDTQIQNIPAIRTYTACGFKAIDSYFTFRILIKK